MTRALLCLLVALVVAACFETALTLATEFLPSTGFGAPFAIGTTSLLLLGSTEAPHAGELMCLNIFFTGALLWLGTVAWRLRGLAVGSLGLVVGLAVQLVSLSRRGTGPIGGFPLPLNRTDGGAIDSVVMWLNCLLMGAIAVFAWRVFVGRFLRRFQRRAVERM